MTFDQTKPNISRIYDYVLGGHHNLEIDRLAAQQIIKVFPSYPQWARLNRWFLQYVAERWQAEGQQWILDLGSGMPTQGHFNSILTDAKIFFTDSDPITVAYAKEVIGDEPRIIYIQLDLREPEALLGAADQHFGGTRLVAIGFIGVAYFLDDAALSRLMHMLHDWAAPGSVMAFSHVSGEVRTEQNKAASDSFKRSGAEIFPRNAEQIRQIVQPWQIRELKPLATWLGAESLIEERHREGTDAEIFGVLLEHAG